MHFEFLVFSHLLTWSERCLSPVLQPPVHAGVPQGSVSGPFAFTCPRCLMRRRGFCPSLCWRHRFAHEDPQIWCTSGVSLRTICLYLPQTPHSEIWFLSIFMPTTQIYLPVKTHRPGLPSQILPSAGPPPGINSPVLLFESDLSF